ncbi:Uncharacterised protein [Klebsiella oxytoca]|nr:Uncharacterised protein [Klebsiella oxytoca]
MHSEAVNEGAGRVIHTLDLHFRAFATELDNHPVQRAHGGDIPEVGVRYVNHHALHRFTEVEVAHKAIG